MRKLWGPRFITVDLEVWSREDLAVLAAAVEPSSASVVHLGKLRGKFHATINATSSSPASPEQDIWALLEVIKSFPRSASRLWKRAESRDFNLGFDAGNFLTLLHERPVGSGRWYARGSTKAGPCETSLSPELLRAVAKVGGTITTTIYPPMSEVPSRRPKRSAGK